MSRIGVFTLPHTGHLYPATALGRKLAERGHEVIFFSFVVTKAIIRAAGLSLYPLQARSTCDFPKRNWPRSKVLSSLNGLHVSTRMVLNEGREAVKDARIDALVVDQMDFAAGTVADSLDVPFVSISIVPPIYLSANVPPICSGWQYSDGRFAQLRNRVGNALFSLFLSSVLAVVNEERRRWALPRLRDVNDTVSPRALITQMPEALDFPRHGTPKQLFYTGPFHDGRGRRAVKFPWERLTNGPLIYASMGTRRNDDYRVFRMIAEACREMDAQLVMSTGGNLQEIGPLAGSPIVVPYAPQLEILARASLTITHGGINTTLESLANGVPLVVIPVADDQPGVAARVQWVAAGSAVPFRRLSVKRVQEAIQQVMNESGYRMAAKQVQAVIQKVNGLERAADLVEHGLK